MNAKFIPNTNHTHTCKTIYSNCTRCPRYQNVLRSIVNIHPVFHEAIAGSLVHERSIIKRTTLFLRAPKKLPVILLFCQPSHQTGCPQTKKCPASPISPSIHGETYDMKPISRVIVACCTPEDVQHKKTKV